MEDALDCQDPVEATVRKRQGAGICLNKQDRVIVLRLDCLAGYGDLPWGDVYACQAHAAPAFVDGSQGTANATAGIQHRLVVTKFRRREDLRIQPVHRLDIICDFAGRVPRILPIAPVHEPLEHTGRRVLPPSLFK